MEKTRAVIGVGNPFRGDDGIGVFLLHELQKNNPDLKRTMDMLDGGTGGMNLYHLINNYEIVLIIDAVNFDASPGEYILFSFDEIHTSNKISSTVSTHGNDVFSVLRTIQRHAEHPPKIFIFGIQPKQVSLSEGFSEEIQQNIPVYLNELIRWFTELL